MKLLHKMCPALLVVGALSLTLLAGCGGGADVDPAAPSVKPETEAAMTQQPAEGENFRPADTSVPPQAEFSFPVMGMKAILPQGLQDAMKAGTIFMQGRQSVNPEGTALAYAHLFWNTLTEEQRAMEVPFEGDAYEEWISGLDRIGTLGVYHKDVVDRLDEFTLCSEHTLVGESPDGMYQYYLSVNPSADAAALEAVKGVQVEISEMPPFPAGGSAFNTDGPEAYSVGSFTMQDINGETYTQDMFKDYDLTVLNLFTTWCSPCVQEIPELEVLRQQMAGKGVNVVGIVLDTVDPMGQPDPSIIEKAHVLAERTGATYPFLVPDETAMNGHLLGIDSVPQTLFVDRQGNIVYSIPGARDLAAWTDLVESVLAEMKGA